MKRILSMLLLFCVCFTAIFPVTAFAAADTAPALGTSEPEPDDSGATPGDTSEGGETPELSLFSEFTGEENEYFTRIRLTVTDREGNPVPGAVYGLYTADGELLQSLTTDTYGVALSDDVPVYTDYYLEEITPPTGFAPNTGRREIILAEVCAPSRVDVGAEYDPITGQIKVIKTDENGNPIYGVGFYVYRSDTGALADTVYTGYDGTALSTVLPYGLYELYEFDYPEWYAGGGYNSVMVENDGAEHEISVVNYLARGGVTVYKTGNDGREIPGAVYSVYRRSLNPTRDSVALRSLPDLEQSEHWEWIEDITTDSGGYAYSNSLFTGDSYCIVEKSVPAPYELDEEPREFTLSYNGDNAYFHFINRRGGDDGRVRVIKTDDGGNALSGVVFGIYRAWDGMKIAELTTDADGIAESEPLIPQDYYLVELAGVAGYEMAAGQIPFTVDGSGATVEMEVINPKIRVFGKVKVVKEDDTGTPIPGVTFGVYCAQHNLLEEITTGTDGTATSGVLNGGSGYYLMEIEGAPGYVADTETQYPFDITEDGATVAIEVVNPRMSGSVKVIKTDGGGNPLAGVVFGVYSVADGGKVAELTTGSDGTAETALYYGDYELRELATVDGYQTIDEPIPFSILEQGAAIELPITNALIIGSVHILKTDEDGELLPGVVFEVYSVAGGGRVAELTTDKNGEAEISLPLARYSLRETKTATGYRLPQGGISVTLAAEGAAVVLQIQNQKEQAEPAPGYIQIVKKAEGTDKPLSGAVFGIYTASGNQKVAELTTGGNGTVISPALAENDYYLLELTAPAGYALNSEKISFHLSAGETREISVTNALLPAEDEEPEPGELLLTKEAEDTGDRLTGAVFGVYSADGGEKQGEITTGRNGRASMELDAGRFYLLELKAPQGFERGKDKTYFTVKSGETTEITVENTAIAATPTPTPTTPATPTTPTTPAQPKTGTLELLKSAEGTGARLSGAVFGVYSVDGNKKQGEITTDGNGFAKMVLAAGDYYLRELTAPTGYLAEKDKIYFTVAVGVTVYVEVTNMRDPDAPIIIPKTGGDYPAMSYALSALCFALAAVCGAALWKRRRKRVAAR